MCIDCILQGNHKNHEILSVEKAVQKEIYLLNMSIKQAI